MVTRDGVVMQEERQTLQAEGFESGLEGHVGDHKQWYKADGTPLGGLLPVDEYHYKRFQAKGWTLTPPAVFINDSEGSSIVHPDPAAFLNDPEKLSSAEPVDGQETE